MDVAAVLDAELLEMRASRKTIVHVQIAAFQKLKTIAGAAQRVSEFPAFYRVAFPF